MWKGNEKYVPTLFGSIFHSMCCKVDHVAVEDSKMILFYSL